MPDQLSGWYKHITTRYKQLLQWRQTLLCRAKTRRHHPPQKHSRSVPPASAQKICMRLRSRCEPYSPNTSLQSFSGSFRVDRLWRLHIVFHHTKQLHVATIRATQSHRSSARSQANNLTKILKQEVARIFAWHCANAYMHVSGRQNTNHHHTSIYSYPPMPPPPQT